MSLDLGLLLLRVVVGLLFIGHGTQKLFGWFGGPGLNGMAGWLSSTGMRPAMFWAFMAGVSEAGGGLLLALGLLNPLGTLGITAAMLVAIISVHWGRFWGTDNGIEVPLVYLVTVTTIALTGAGTYSLDAALGISLPMPLSYLGGMVLVILGVVTSIITTRKPVVAAEPAAEVSEIRQAA